MVIKIISAVLIVLLLTALGDFLYIKFAGSPVGVPASERAARQFGSGEPLSFAILGDSRVVGQGGDYEQGVALTVARHIAKNRQVTLHNLGKSGAKTHDVLISQVPELDAVSPDLVVILVGANDVTHLTSVKEVENDMQSIVLAVKAKHPKTAIVMTDAGALWSVPRIPHPLRYFAGLRSKQINQDFERIAAQQGVVYAPVGKLTGDAFVHDHSNFAADKFHPSTKGYTLLGNALLPYIDKALQVK